MVSLSAHYPLSIVRVSMSCANSDISHVAITQRDLRNGLQTSNRGR